MKTLRAMGAGRIICAVLLAANIVFGVLNAMAGSFVALISAVAVVVLSVSLVLQTRNIRARAEQLRPGPDYAAIARMEREIFGEAFEHQGGSAWPSDRYPSAVLPGHSPRRLYHCRMCEDRYRMQELGLLRRAGQEALRWVRTYERDLDYIESINGVLWADAPLPPARHHCKAQTRGWFGLSYTERCACGAARCSASGPWIEKNETRRRRDA